MQLTAKAHYATVAMIELAKQHEKGLPTAVRSISDQHGIPLPFLVQILQQLKSAGLVAASRGAGGGYRLERAPSAISLLEIVDSVCSQPVFDSISETGEPEASRANQVVRSVWEEVDAAQRNVLSSVTLEDLQNRLREQLAEMFYI